MLSDCCLSCPVLSCLSVTLVYCGQTVGWIKVPLGVEVGLGPAHIVLDVPIRGTQQPPLLGLYLLLPNGWMDQDATKVGLGPGDIVLDWDPALPHSKGHSSPHHFSGHVYCG